MNQRGMGLVITVMLILVVAIVAVLVATSFSGSSIRDTAASGESAEALYLAETAVERALKRFATGTPCASLTDGAATELVAGSGRTFQITKAATTDFSGANLAPSLTQCRVEAEGKVSSSNVSRRVQAILDKNLAGGAIAGGANNEDFNDPAAAGAPSGWTLNPAGTFADNGGPDGTAPNCTRSAYVAKENTGGGANNRRASGSTNVTFAVTASSTTNVAFHSRVVTRSSAAGCPAGSAGPALPAGCTATADGTICFELTGTGGPGTWIGPYNTPATLVGGGCSPTSNPCEANYQASYPTKNLISMTMTGANSVSAFTYYMQLQNVTNGGGTPGTAGRKEMFLDSIEVWNDTAIGAARVQYWRDCTVASCP